MTTPNAKVIRRTIGFIVILAILLRGQAIINIVETHAWVGIILLLCALAYVLWGMFWRGDNA